MNMSNVPSGEHASQLYGTKTDKAEQRQENHLVTLLLLLADSFTIHSKKSEQKDNSWEKQEHPCVKNHGVQKVDRPLGASLYYESWLCIDAEWQII